MNQLKTTGIVLSAAPYSFPNEKTGEIIEGITVFTLPMTELKPQKNRDTHGVKPYKSTLPLDVIGKIIAAPAIYEFTCEMTVDRDMKPQLKVTDLEYKGEYLPYILMNMTETQYDETFTAEIVGKINQMTRKNRGAS
jgi:hypothetical protein